MTIEEEIIVAEIIVPELAESITEGTISQWLKQPGETLNVVNLSLNLKQIK